MASRSSFESSRRTASSPYLASLNTRSYSQYRPKERTSNIPTRTRHGSSSRVERRKATVVPPRGAQSAPPIYSSGYPGMRDHYERRAELQKEVHKTLIKTKYDRLVAFQEKISKEIDDLEKAAGEVGIRVKKPNPPEPSSEEPKPKLKQFRVLGGRVTSLGYKIQRKADTDGKIRSFSLEVNVKGFMSENIEILTEDEEMFIRASKMNGTKRELKVIAPSVKDMEKAYIHPPRFGVLVIDF